MLLKGGLFRLNPSFSLKRVVLVQGSQSLHINRRLDTLYYLQDPRFPNPQKVEIWGKFYFAEIGVTSLVYWKEGSSQWQFQRRKAEEVKEQGCKDVMKKMNDYFYWLFGFLLKLLHFRIAWTDVLPFRKTTENSFVVYLCNIKEENNDRLEFRGTVIQKEP